MNAIRKTAPHAILAAAIMAAGATAVIVINVGLLDYASGSVGSLSPRTAVAHQKKTQPAVKLHAKKPRRRTRPEAQVKLKRSVVHTAAPVAKVAPQPAQGSSSAASSATKASKTAPKKASPSTQTKSKPPPATTTTSESEDGQTHHRRSREHEDEHEPGDD